MFPIEELRYLLIDSRTPTQGFSCKLLSSMFASLLSNVRNRCFIIDSNEHSVVFDGKDTWDISLGIVLRNYQYPNTNVPKPEMIEEFKHWFSEKQFNKYYSLKKLESAKTQVMIKEIKNIGVYNATKKD